MLILLLMTMARSYLLMVQESMLVNRLSIVLDGEVISSPTVQCAITGGEAVISSVDSYEEAAKAGEF